MIFRLFSIKNELYSPVKIMLRIIRDFTQYFLITKNAVESVFFARLENFVLPIELGFFWQHNFLNEVRE